MKNQSAATKAKERFERLGIVATKSIATRRDGYRIIYDVLMKEATQKGADKIINVSISSTGGFYTRVWSGSALAIRYLDAV